MKIDDIRRIVVDWAKTHSVVRKVWLFGSRVRGTERPDSDIDVAIEVLRRDGDSNEFTTFMFEKESLTTSLARLLPIAVHLDWYGGADETPTMHAGLQESSILVFEAMEHG